MRLGEILIKADAISEKQLQAALGEQQRWGGLLGEILVRMEYLAEETLLLALSRQLGVQRAEPALVEAPDARAVQKLSPGAAGSLRSVPLALQDAGRTLVVAMAEPQNLSQLDELRRATGCKLSPRLVGPVSLTRLHSRAYGSADPSLEEEGEIFKVVDAQGRTMIKSVDEVRAEAVVPPARPPAAAPSPRAPAVPPPRPAAPPPVARPAPEAKPPADDSLHGILKRLEDAQRKEVAALRAMVELLIERGVFSRDEYLARIRR